MIEQLPEWAQFLFEPFSRFTFETVGVWYIWTVIVMFLLGGIGRLAGAEFENPLEGYTLWEKITMGAIGAPVAEELIFRIVPMWFGAPAMAVIGLSVVWALLHGKRWLVIMVTVPLYVKMALAGMFVELIAVHVFHNTWAVLISHVAELAGEETE